MKNKNIRTITDIAMFVVMSFLAGTGLLLHFRIGPGYQGARVLGFSRHEWGTYHLWAAYLLLFLILVHLILNFAFIINVIATKKRWIVIALGLLGIFITALFLLLPVKRTAESGQGHGQGHGRRSGTGQGRHEAGQL